MLQLEWRLLPKEWLQLVLVMLQLEWRLLPKEWLQLVLVMLQQGMLVMLRHRFYSL
jgi:hypothetical protein